MSVAYKRDEMVGITELSKSLGKYLDKVVSGSLNRLVIIRRNEPEAIIVPIDEYEYMKASVDYIKDMKITEVIKKRVKNDWKTTTYKRYTKLTKLL